MVERYGGGIAARAAQAYAARLGRAASSEEAQEIVQEVFFRLVRDDARLLREFEGRSGLASYLSAVAAFCVLERLRGAGRRRRHEAQLLESLRAAGAPGDATADPLAAAVEEEQAESVRKAMEGLGDRDRLVVRLHFWEGAGFVEIGRLLGVDRKYARVILQRALDRMRERLASL